VAQARSDVVGSLLRPPRLLEARERFAGGELSTAELKAVEDDAVDGALRLQEEEGVEVVTDGEMRRLSFQSQLPSAVEGFSYWDLDAFLWGDWHGTTRSATCGSSVQSWPWSGSCDAVVPYAPRSSLTHVVAPIGC
jgi:methionine synthase II (cobalamin-independent)